MVTHMKISSTADHAEHKIKAIVYGESGAGKTTLAKTLDGKTLIINGESGLLSLHGTDIAMVDLSKDDAGVVISDPAARIRRLGEVFAMLQAGTPYTNIFLDSLTEINELVVASLNKEFPDRKDSLVLWGENAKRMTSIIKSFRDLPYNVYMTCLSKIDKDENSQRFHALALSGKVADNAPQYFDLVLFLHADGEGKRMLVTSKTPKNVCKDRSGRLSVTEDADLGHIARKIAIPPPVNASKTKEK